MTTPAEVDRVLRGLIRRFDEAEAPAKESLPSDRTIVCAITDLELAYRGDYRGGKVRKFATVENGSRGDVTIRVSSDDLVALAEGRLSLTRALMTGRLGVDAGISDLLLLRQLL